MQRIGLPLVGLLALFGQPLHGQQAAGAMLWRVAATTLATPPALALGPAAALWNPAQTEDGARLQVGIEAIQTPSAVDASGLIATVRIPSGALGQLGVIFGRVGLSDISQTIDSPDPTGGTIAVYTYAAAATWSRLIGHTSVGATLAFHETRLDVNSADRWTVDVGASREIAGDRLRLAAATHFFSSLKTNDPAQDVFAGIEGRLWSRPVSGDRLVVRGRYGIAFAHGFSADHQIGIGGELPKTGGLDIMLARDGGYGDKSSSWRPVVGMRVIIGKYRVTVARDGGVNDLGSAYRVGIDMRFK
jgi:hypothetical protein